MKCNAMNTGLTIVRDNLRYERSKFCCRLFSTLQKGSKFARVSMILIVMPIAVSLVRPIVSHAAVASAPEGALGQYRFQQLETLLASLEHFAGHIHLKKNRDTGQSIAHEVQDTSRGWFGIASILDSLYSQNGGSSISGQWVEVDITDIFRRRRTMAGVSQFIKKIAIAVSDKTSSGDSTNTTNVDQMASIDEALEALLVAVSRLGKGYGLKEVGNLDEIEKNGMRLVFTDSSDSRQVQVDFIDQGVTGTADSMGIAISTNYDSSEKFEDHGRYNVKLERFICERDLSNDLRAIMGTLGEKLAVPKASSGALTRADLASLTAYLSDRKDVKASDIGFFLLSDKINTLTIKLDRNGFLRSVRVAQPAERQLRERRAAVASSHY